MCKYTKAYKHNHQCISTLLLLASLADAVSVLPWNSTQQNDDFIHLLLDKPPVGINIFAHYEHLTYPFSHKGKVPDARGWDYDLDVDGASYYLPKKETMREGESTNSANIVSSLDIRHINSVTWPAALKPTFTVCWATRYHWLYASDSVWPAQ